MARTAKSLDRPSLYLSEPEIAELVLPPTKAREWPDIAAVLEREGLPRIDPIMGGRYWPAVRAWLDRRHGLRKGHVTATADGEESWQ